MIKRKGIDGFISFFMILIALRNICLFFSLSNFATIVFYASYITFALLLVVVVLARIQKPIKITLFFVVSTLLVISLIVIPMSYGVSAWVANGYTPISFFMTMIFWIMSKDLCISKKTIKICYIVNVIQAVVAIICAFIPGSFESDGLVLHIGNPNQTSLVLWSAFSFCFLYWANDKGGKRGTILLWLLMVGLMVMIFLTRSRAGLISCVVCIGGYFWINKKTGSRMIPSVVRKILILFPIFVPVVILLLFNVLPKEITIFGKLLFSGREQIWQNIADEFFANPFSSHLLSSPYYSRILYKGEEILKAWGPHNGVLAIQWNYGLIVTILSLFIFFTRIKDLEKSSYLNKNSCMVYIVVLATLLTLAFEEGILMGNICTTMILPMLLIVGHSEKNNNELILIE